MGCDFYPLLIAEEKMGECERLAAAVVDSPVDISVVTVVVVTGNVVCPRAGAISNQMPFNTHCVLGLCETQVTY